MSTLGVGVQVAARAVPRAGVRIGFNVLGYSRTFTKDGIPYDAHLDLRTVEGHFDFFPRAPGNLYVSLGVMGFFGDPILARTSIAGGQSFTLGGTTYYSDPATPTHGTGKIDFNAAAPMVTAGWANLIPHSHGHFSIPVELGVAFQGSPKTTLHLAGYACLAAGTDCVNVASDSAVQANVLSEQSKINGSVSAFKVYPIISVGFGYTF